MFASRYYRQRGSSAAIAQHCRRRRLQLSDYRQNTSSPVRSGHAGVRPAAPLSVPPRVRVLRRRERWEKRLSHSPGHRWLSSAPPSVRSGEGASRLTHYLTGAGRTPGSQAARSLPYERHHLKLIFRNASGIVGLRGEATRSPRLKRAFSKPSAALWSNERRLALG